MALTRALRRVRAAGAGLRVGLWAVPPGVLGILGRDAHAEPLDPRRLSAADHDVVLCGARGYAVAAALLPAEVPLVVHADRLGDLPADPARAVAVVVPTEEEAEVLRRSPSLRRAEVVTVPPAIDSERRTRSSLAEPVLVAVEPLVPDQRHLALVRAFADIADRLPSWRLRIVGTGPHREPILGEARRRRVADRVEVVEPTPTDPRGAVEWAAAGLGVVVARQGGLAAAAGAMAAGVPVVAFDSLGGPRDLLSDSRAGALVPAGDEAALGAAILRLARDPARPEHGAAALETVSERLAPAVVGARWTELLAKVAAGATTANPAPLGSDRPAPLVTPADARAEILAWVAGIAASVSDVWWALPPPAGGAPVVVLPESRREQLLAAIEARPGPAYTWIGVPELAGKPGRRGPVADMLGPLRRGADPVLTFAPGPGPDGRPHHLSAGADVDVELWTEAGGTLRAPRRNVFAQRVDPAHPTTTATVAGVEVRTLPEMTRRTVHECAFPVDVVYTWVDGDDPSWQAARDRRLEEATGGTVRTAAASGAARFRARDELRYSMRSVHLFAPWVRTIHLVTDAQRPAWLLDDPRVRLVDHRDILPPEALPTFNSHAIESRLHHVPDLAEHFVYLNDDVFLARPLDPTAFFTPSGLPHAFVGAAPIGVEAPDRPDLAAAANNRRLLEREYGVTITLMLAHTPHPHRVSLLAELEERFAEEWGRTTASPFRSPTDLSPLSSLAQHAGLVTGRMVAAEHRLEFVNLFGPRLPLRLEEVLARQQDSICLGDHHDYALPEEQVSELLAQFLEDYFPVAAPWERG